MSLTIPTAGTTAGRAAELQFEAPQTGAVLSQFGDVVKGLGDRLEKDRLDLESGRLQIDMTRDLNKLRLKYAEMGDPEAIERGWAADIDGLKQGYMTGKTEAGRPRVDPKLADQFGLMFDDLAERHAFALGTNVLALRQSQSAANRIEYEAVLAQSAANADPATRETLYEQNDADLDRLVLKAVIPPDVAAAAKLKARQTGDFNAFVTDLGKDTDGARAALEAGSYGHMTPEDRVRAEAALASADEKARVLADKAVADGLAVKKEQAGEAIKLLNDGKPASGVTLLQDPEFVAAQPDLAADLKGAEWVFRNVRTINLMSEAQLTEAVTEWSGRTFDRNADADGLRMLQKRLADVRAAKRTDAIALWKTSGLGLGDIDFSAPDAGAQLAQRAIDVGRLVKSGHLDKPVFLDADEAAQVKERTGVNADPRQRLDTALMLQGAFGAESPDVVTRITGDAALGGVAAMLDAGVGGQALATQILAGQRAAAENGLPLPSESAWREVVGAQFGGLFTDGTGEGTPDENSDLRMLGEMAFGLYVWRKGKSADLTDGKIDAAALEQAFHDVAGGTGEFGSSDATGGIQTVRGFKTALPPGIRAEEIDDAWRIVAESVAVGKNPRIGTRDPEGLFRAMSADGKTMPRINGKKIDPETMGNLHLRALNQGDGYSLVWTDPDTGDEFVVMANDMRPYVMDLDALLRIAGDAP